MLLFKGFLDQLFDLIAVNLLVFEVEELRIDSGKKVDDILSFVDLAEPTFADIILGKDFVDLYSPGDFSIGITFLHLLFILLDVFFNSIVDLFTSFFFVFAGLCAIFK